MGFRLIRAAPTSSGVIFASTETIACDAYEKVWCNICRCNGSLNDSKGEHIYPETTAKNDRRLTEAVSIAQRTSYEETDLSKVSDDSNVREDLAMPRKRPRRGKLSKHNKQDTTDFWPAAGNFNLDNIPMEDPEDEEDMMLEIQDPIEPLAEVAHPSSADAAVVTQESNVQASRLANDAYPSTGITIGSHFVQHTNKSTTATSQVPSKYAKDVRSKLPKHLEMRIGGQETSTGLAHIRLEGFLRRLSGLNPHDNHPDFKFAEQEVRNARVDYNYCLYYPSSKEWRPPPPTSDKRDMVKGAKSLTKSKQWRAALWRLVEKSMEGGELEKIKDGSLVAKEIPLNISDAVESVSHELNEQTGDDDRELSEAEILGSRESSLGSLLGDSEQIMINVSDGKAGAIVETKEDSPAAEKAEAAPPDYIEVISSAEEGELDDDASIPEDRDAMMDYSNSAQLQKEKLGPQQLDGPMDLQSKDLILKDLSTEVLNKQLRYFHVGKSSADIDLGLPVKCLSCGGDGHDSVDCKSLTCSNCKAYNKHITLRCPTRLKCSRCRSSGHQESQCPYKLKLVSSEEITCDLCQLPGHVEEDCELMWRTSGQSWVPRTSDLAYIRLSCYECGNQGHLGNDCSTRRPGKGFGSSSWSIFQRFDVPLRSEEDPQDTFHSKSHLRDRKGVGMKIKGRANNNPLPPPPETLPDRDSFLRPKRIPEPVRRSVIHINADTSQRLSETPRSASLVSVRHPFRDYGLVKEERRETNGRDDARDSDFARYNHGNPMFDGNYDRPRRRSRSPPPNSHKRNYREDRYRPDPPPPPRAYRNDNLYRPMPSAAQNAYSRHRM